MVTMEHVGIDVEATRPTRCPGNRVDPYLSERNVVIDRAEDPNQNTLQIQFRVRPSERKR